MNSSMNNLITNPFHSTTCGDDKFSSMLTSEPQCDFLIGNNLDSEQFNILLVVMISCLQIISLCRLMNQQLARQSSENLNNLFTDEQYDYIDQQVPLLMSTPKPPGRNAKQEMVQPIVHQQ